MVLGSRGSVIARAQTGSPMPSAPTSPDGSQHVQADIAGSQSNRRTPQHSGSSGQQPRMPGPVMAGRSQGKAEIDCDNDALGKGVISLLQEFVQCSKYFHAPQHRPILQWNFDTRMADFTSLEFRAQVAFLLDGVPHHAAGSWQPSKKLAQRDAAERALSFFVGCWGEQLLEQPCSFEATAKQLPEKEVLQEFCRKFPACEGATPNWDVMWDKNNDCRACLQVNLMGVPHKFTGPLRATAEEACAATSCRVLWYMQCPGFQDSFEPDPNGAAAVAKDIPSPPSNWANDSGEEDAVQAADRKTALMRVQNRLQQVFARLLRPGQSVWEWSYETDPDDASWPPLCRAKVSVPAAGRIFVGRWVRGQREAQLEACSQVAAALEKDGSGQA